MITHPQKEQRESDLYICLCQSFMNIFIAVKTFLKGLKKTNNGTRNRKERI